VVSTRRVQPQAAASKSRTPGSGRVSSHTANHAVPHADAATASERKLSRPRSTNSDTNASSNETNSTVTESTRLTSQRGALRARCGNSSVSRTGAPHSGHFPARGCIRRL
jgi:hypothetical protein